MTDQFVCAAATDDHDIEKPKVDRVEHTTHQGSRNNTDIDHIVIHYTTSRDIDGTIAWFKPGPGKKQTSAHYIVGRDGLLVQMVPDNATAWHAGNKQMNWRSIGIEHVAAVGDAITPEQSAKSRALIAWLMAVYDIPQANVIPHVCVKATDCCGDLFSAFGGSAGASCEDQRAAVQAWLNASPP